MIDTDIPNLDLYIDTDSIVYLNDDECLYSIRYKEVNKPEKYAYLKSNSSTNYIGIIQTGEAGVDTYKPQIVYRNTHVFMKQVPENSFLSYVHEYATTRMDSDNLAQSTPTLRDNNVKPIAYKLSNNLQEFTKNTSSMLLANWNPPTSGRNTQATIVLTIGVDGSLQNYKFVKSSEDEATDRSIITAVEKTVPYAKFPRLASSTEPSNFQFTFDYKLLQKSVY
jgi:hypothetical protein